MTSPSPPRLPPSEVNRWARHPLRRLIPTRRDSVKPPDITASTICPSRSDSPSKIESHASQPHEGNGSTCQRPNLTTRPGNDVKPTAIGAAFDGRGVTRRVSRAGSDPRSRSGSRPNAASASTSYRTTSRSSSTAAKSWSGAKRSGSVIRPYASSGGPSKPQRLPLIRSFCQRIGARSEIFADLRGYGNASRVDIVRTRQTGIPGRVRWR